VDPRAPALFFGKVKLLAHPAKTGQARLGLPGNVDSITGSAFLPAPAYWQEGGASSRLARGSLFLPKSEKIWDFCQLHFHSWLPKKWAKSKKNAVDSYH